MRRRKPSKYVLSNTFNIAPQVIYAVAVSEVLEMEHNHRRQAVVSGGPSAEIRNPLPAALLRPVSPVAPVAPLMFDPTVIRVHGWRCGRRQESPPIQSEGGKPVMSSFESGLCGGILDVNVSACAVQRRQHHMLALAGPVGPACAYRSGCASIALNPLRPRHYQPNRHAEPYWCCR